ncbi:hypothetical protein C9374_002596 [Naegleria lovaniensis]|uniref:RNA-dependent RNA polymerase n=1 Tax=Naegleria lovaniensis TaxID=51637 RepID=A0AA88GNS1_NAELO|nr:uncharacterized protein C9374_002596 [Naegleria lovaniensis]KAG2386150.1 hypothetical protein C9374_002596 [Naegleria lovaniensis]
MDKSKYMIVFQKPVLNVEDMIRHGVMKMYFYLKDSHGNEYKSKKYDFMVPGEQSIPCSGMIDSQVSNVNNTIDSSVPIERRLVLKKLKESPLGSSLSDIHFNQFLSNLFENISSSTLELFNMSTFPYFGNYDIQKHTFTLTDDGRGRDSAWHSCCRFSQILISLNLGKALLFVRMINTKKPNGQQQSSNGSNSSPQKSLTFDEAQKFNSSHIEFACQSLIQIPTMKGNYKFFATSNSGTKGETCCFVHDSFNLQQLRNLLGDFSKAEKSGPCKTFSRVALNFGKCVKSDRPLCEEEQVAYLPPEYEMEFPGTDGIGFIHEHLAHELLLNINDFVTREKLLFNNQKELRGVGAIQVRYSGCKGVLQLIPASYWPFFRKSTN